MSIPLIPLIAIFVTAITSAVVSGFVVYTAQHSKIDEMKREGRKALREARLEEYEKGLKAGQAQAKAVDPVLVDIVQKAYQDGYEDGVANERDMTDKTTSIGRHQWVNDVPTNMFPVVNKNSMDDSTQVMVASNFTADGDTAVISPVVTYDAA